jgi:hypothetical protein
MNKLELDLFAVPFMLTTLGEKSRQLNKKLIKDLHEDRNVNPEAPLRTGVHVWQSKFAIEKRYESFSNLVNIIFSTCEPTLRKAGFTGDLSSYMECIDLWGNINENPYAYHTPHFHGHGHTVFTGIYYPSSGVLDGVNISDSENLDELTKIEATSRPKPGSVVFMDPAANVKRQVYPLGDKLNRYPYYSMDIAVTPKESTLLLAPHYVSHYVVPTEKPGLTRYSIPFSINLKR